MSVRSEYTWRAVRFVVSRRLEEKEIPQGMAAGWCAIHCGGARTTVHQPIWSDLEWFEFSRSIHRTLLGGTSYQKLGLLRNTGSTEHSSKRESNQGKAEASAMFASLKRASEAREETK